MKLLLRPLLILLERIFRKIHKLLNYAFPHLNPYFGMILYKPELVVDIVSKNFDYPKTNIKYTIITPVLNEGDNIKSVLQAIENQILKPDEVVIVDGGSKDATLEIIKSYMQEASFEIKLLHSKIANIGYQRNLAIKNAKNNLLLNVDAGTIPPKEYAVNMMMPFLEDEKIDLVGGINYPIEEKPWSRNFSPREHFIDNIKPNGNSVAFKKDIAIKSGLYPEYISNAGEDTLFFYRYQKLSKKWLLNRKAGIAWHHPTSIEEVVKKKKNYIKANFEIGLWGYYYYKFKLFKFMTFLYSEYKYVAEYLNDFLIMQSEIEIKKRKIKGLYCIYSDLPLQHVEQKVRDFAFKKISENFKVFFIYTSSSKAFSEFYLDTDITLLELYYYKHFDIKSLLSRYDGFLDKTSIVIPKTLRADLNMNLIQKACLQGNLLYDVS